MPDETYRPPPNDDEQPDLSPSSLFLEMMRQAAQQNKPDVDPFKPDLSDFVVADELPAEDPTPEFELETDDSDRVDEALAPPHFDELEPFEIEDESPEWLQELEENVEEQESEIIEAASAEDSAQMIESDAPRIPIYPVPAIEEEIDPAEQERQEQLEAQRIRRIKRRQERRHRRRVGILGGLFRTVFITTFATALAATIFTWFTQPDWIQPSVISSLQVANATSAAAEAGLSPTSIPVTPNWLRRIGVVSGHRGPENDPGAVCDDGLTETEVNFNIAQIVVRELRSRGFTVDLLDEFDPRLDGYKAAALVSLHSNDCRDYGERVSGYLVARAAARPSGGVDDMLAECIALHYERGTELERRVGLTADMTDYHTFREIYPLTPAAILELGFLRADRALLTEQQDLLAQSVIDGIMCFLDGENPILEMTASAPTPTPFGTPSDENSTPNP